MIECTITFNGGAILHLKGTTPRDKELLRLAFQDGVPKSARPAGEDTYDVIVEMPKKP